MTHRLVKTGHLVFVLVSKEEIMMCSTIDKPTSYEFRAVIRFPHAKNISVAEIHSELCTV
jgi:hypothetical protein